MLIVSAKIVTSSFFAIQSVSEIGGQTLRAYSTCSKDEKKSDKHGSGNASFTSYKHFLLILQKLLEMISFRINACFTPTSHRLSKNVQNFLGCFVFFHAQR